MASDLPENMAVDRAKWPKRGEKKKDSCSQT